MSFNDTINSYLMRPVRSAALRAESGVPHTFGLIQINLALIKLAQPRHAIQAAPGLDVAGAIGLNGDLATAAQWRAARKGAHARALLPVGDS
jgi:hypothetical protein